MRAAQIVILVLVGFAAGWFTREATRDDPTPRSGPKGAYVPDDPAARRSSGGAAAEAPPRKSPPPVRFGGSAETRGPGPETAEEALATEGAEPGGKEADFLAEMVKSQSAQWKAWASMQTGQKIDALLRELGFDEATAKLIKEAMQKEAEKQTDRAIAMFLGEEEMDADAFAYFMGLPPDLSPDLERELATFLRPDDLGVLREGVKKAHERQTRDLADMQINMMGIADLTDVQRTELREVFGGKDIMQEQMTQFAEVTRDREKLSKLLAGEGLTEAMEQNFAPTRARMKQILNPQQFEKYKAYEQMMIKQAEMGLKMMTGSLTQKTETKKPDGQ